MAELSVIVPIYNVEDYVRLCIDSILTQTYQDMEVILVDDGSTDRSGMICEEYARKDRRVVVIHKENGGLVSARKAGILACTGKYITYVDGDDWISPNTYEVLLEWMRNYQVDIVTAGYMEEFETCVREYRDYVQPGYYDKERLIKCLYQNMLYKEEIEEPGLRPNVWSKIFVRKVLVCCQMEVDERIQYGEDMACTYPALLKAESVYVTDACLYHYRRRADSITGCKDHGYFEQIGILYKKLSEIFCGYNGLSDFLIRQLNNYMKILLDIGERDLLNLRSTFGKREKKSYYLFPYEAVEKSSRIIVYGAGIVGQDYMSQLKSAVYVKSAAWADKNYLEYVKRGFLVCSPDSCVAEGFDQIVIAILKEVVAKEIRQELIEKGVPEHKIFWKPPVKVRQVIPDKYREGE